MPTLSDLAKLSAADTSGDEIDIDLAAAFGITPEPGKEADYILRWRKPSIPHIYTLSTVCPKLQEKHPLWPAGMVYDVVLMSMCHVAPPPEPGTTIASYYEGMVEGPSKNDRLFWYLLERLTMEWPDVARREVVEEAANRNPQLLDKLADMGVRSKYVGIAEPDKGKEDE